MVLFLNPLMNFLNFYRIPAVLKHWVNINCKFFVDHQTLYYIYSLHLPLS
jgi:hypothetical protein